MPRYYFHYGDSDDNVVEDRIGRHHPNLERVEQEAHLVAREILEDEMRRGGSVSATRCLEIEDESGEIVLYVPFWAAIPVGGPGDCGTAASLH